MTSNPEPKPLSDSPWFWVLLFGLTALAALAAIGPKYARRQAKLEGKYLGRLAAESASAEDANRRPDDDSSRLVPLATLATVLGVIVVAAGGWLVWRYLHRAAPDGPVTQPADKVTGANRP